MTRRTIVVTARHVLEYEGDGDAEDVAGVWFHVRRSVQSDPLMYAGAQVIHVGSVLADVAETPPRTEAA